MGKRRTYRLLIGALEGRGYDQLAIAQYLGISKSTASTRYTAKSPWTIDEMYKLMDLIGEPYKKMHEYFPRDGKDLYQDKKPYKCSYSPFARAAIRPL